MGQLGDGSIADSAVPVQLSTVKGRAVTGIAAIAAGEDYSLALTFGARVLASAGTHDLTIESTD